MTNSPLPTNAFILSAMLREALRIKTGIPGPVASVTACTSPTSGQYHSTTDLH